MTQYREAGIILRFQDEVILTYKINFVSTIRYIHAKREDGDADFWATAFRALISLTKGQNILDPDWKSRATPIDLNHPWIYPRSVCWCICLSLKQEERDRLLNVNSEEIVFAKVSGIFDILNMYTQAIESNDQVFESDYALAFHYYGQIQPRVYCYSLTSGVCQFKGYLLKFRYLVSWIDARVKSFLK